jgi:hypothetical protein
MPNLITRLINWFILSFNHINTENKQLSESWFRKWLWYHWRRIAIQNAAEIKIFSFRYPYEWSWSVIKYLPLVTIETFGADLLWRSKPLMQIHGNDHERWTMTTSLLSPHERIPSISVLAGTSEGFEWEREKVRKRKECNRQFLLLHKGSIYRTTCVGFKLKAHLSVFWPISYNMPKIT